jgi:hypothetical protein
MVPARRKGMGNNQQSMVTATSAVRLLLVDVHIRSSIIFRFHDIKHAIRKNLQENFDPIDRTFCDALHFASCLCRTVSKGPRRGGRSGRIPSTPLPFVEPHSEPANASQAINQRHP